MGPLVLVFQGVEVRPRLLPPEEWDRINSPGLPELLPYLEPQNLTVAVVEDDEEKIVASVCAINITHFEGLWIVPEHRGNAGVFRPLIRQAYAVPRVKGERWVIGGAEENDAKMRGVCTRLGGQRLPLTFYAMPVGE